MLIGLAVFARVSECVCVCVLIVFALIFVNLNVGVQVHLVATLAICVVGCNVHCLPAFSVLCLNTYIIHTCIMRANEKKKNTGRQGLNDEVKRVEEKGKQMETGRVRAP